MFTQKGVLTNVNKDEMERSRTVLVFTLTSFTISKRNKIQILFHQQASLVKVF